MSRKFVVDSNGETTVVVTTNAAAQVETRDQA